MRKIIIELDDEIADALEAKAVRHNMTTTSLIRRTLIHVAGFTVEERLVQSPSGIGRPRTVRTYTKK